MGGTHSAAEFWDHGIKGCVTLAPAKFCDKVPPEERCVTWSALSVLTWVMGAAHILCGVNLTMSLHATIGLLAACPIWPASNKYMEFMQLSHIGNLRMLAHMAHANIVSLATITCSYYNKLASKVRLLKLPGYLRHCLHFLLPYIRETHHLYQLQCNILMSKRSRLQRYVLHGLTCCAKTNTKTAEVIDSM